MTLEKWIQVAVGSATGLMLSSILFLVEYLIFCITKSMLSAESYFAKTIIFIVYSVNGIFLLLVFFVAFYSWKRNKKEAAKIANAFLLLATTIIVYYWTFG